MKTGNPPRLVPTEELSSYFTGNDIPHQGMGSLKLGFGRGNDQYRLYAYPGQMDNETMGVFCEWHTENFFEHDTNPHIGIGLRGPVKDDPHRGRGLAIGILANKWINPEDPEHPVPLFKGCPDPPGGPSFFIEDFSINDGTAPINEWQLSTGKKIPQLKGRGIYRLDVHVSRYQVWAGVWKVSKKQSISGETLSEYIFLGQASCADDGPGYSGNPGSPCPESALDRGRGNMFIGSAFADPDTRSWVDSIYIAHWKNRI